MLKLKIYVVEDNPLMVSSLLHIISKTRHKVSGVASNYENAVSDLDKLQVDLLITDIMLGGDKTGIDLVDHLKDRLPGTLFIFQSSITDPDLIKKALNTGPVAFLTKPLNKSAILNAISSLTTKKLAAL